MVRGCCATGIAPDVWGPVARRGVGCFGLVGLGGRAGAGGGSAGTD